MIKVYFLFYLDSMKVFLGYASGLMNLYSIYINILFSTNNWI